MMRRTAYGTPVGHGHVISWQHVTDGVVVSCRCGVRSRGWISVMTAAAFTAQHRRAVGLLHGR